MAALIGVGQSAVAVANETTVAHEAAPEICPRPAPWSFPDGNTNRVVLTVETNNRFSRHVESKTMYTSFSLLKSMEGAFRFTCLNHACDSNVNVMSDLFDGERNW